MDKNYLGAISTLVGTIIGAGILGIPYIIAKSGFVAGLIQIVLIGIMVLVVNLLLGEVVLRTQGNHQLTGYADRYLGKKGKIIMMFSMILGNYGAMIAYLIGEGQTLGAVFNFNQMFFTILFFAVFSIFVYKGLKAVEASESVLMIFKMLLFITIFLLIIFSGHFNIRNLTHLDIKNMFLPYGVILFAYLGASAIPEVKEELKKNTKLIKKAILIGTLIPIAVYSLFALGVVGLTGIRTTEIATIGIGNLLGEGILLIVNLFAIVSMATGFLAIALALKEMYQYDFKINKHLAWIITCFVPLILVFLGVKDFISIIGLTGAIAGSMEGCLIVLMYYKARKTGKRKPEYSIGLWKPIGYAIMALFIAGGLLTILM